jgi:hypothetical protein
VSISKRALKTREAIGGKKPGDDLCHAHISKESLSAQFKGGEFGKKGENFWSLGIMH